MKPMSSVSVAAFRAAVADPRAIERYEAKVHRTPGDGCDWWTGAVSGNGHGRLWLADGVTVISHRFGWALAHGADAALAVEVLAHGCDEPLCQNAEHLRPTTNWENRAQWAARRHTRGRSLRDLRGGFGRAVAIRNAVKGGINTELVRRLGIPRGDRDQATLW